MEAARSSGAGSGNSATYAPEIAESFRFEDEIQSLVNQSFEPSSPASNGAGGASFTALLGLQPSEAVELLHGGPDGAAPPMIADPGGGGGGGEWRFRGLVPAFPSNMALVERAARFSVFASGGESPEEASSGEYSPALARAMKAEPADSDPRPICPIRRPAAKRKEGDPNPNAKGKVKSPAAKRSRSGGEERKRKEAEERTGGEEKQQLPYVHVRARRGQATDSHSLAERARREKINARMKLLQELVPGCSKISGTALVLDEIINHVQSLQRQVEFLSMKLAAVNPRIDFGGLDAILSAECGRLTAGANHNYHQAAVQQQMWHVDVVGGHHHLPPPPPAWERDEDTHHHHHHLIGPPQPPPPPGGTASSLFGYASAASVSLSNQLKTEI